MGENDKLKKRAIELAQMSIFQNRYTNTAFLTLEEQDCIKSAMSEKKYHNWFFYGGSESAVRRMAVFGCSSGIGYEYQAPVVVVLVEPLSEKFSEDLSHRDYLGALMSLGIDRSTTGDIIIKDKKAWIFCMENIADFICDNLSSIRHTSVKCRICSTDVPEVTPELKEMKINISSERADAVVAAVLSISRTKAQELIKDERVFVNGSIVKNVSQIFKENDVFVIRGSGKFIFDGMESKTRKGRLYAAVRRYI